MRFEAERAIILPTKSSRVYKGDDRMLIILEKIGWGMLALTGFVGGIIGLALPVIPQVPFFLLALFALSKLSPRFHRWLTSRHWYRECQ